MQDFSAEYVYAFNHAMIYEVGGFWNPEDPDVIEGRMDTKDQRRKVGYVNIPEDKGGETKYGIARNANKDVDVRNLNLQETMEIYYDRYWLAGKCDKIPQVLAIIHFDGCVNHGVGRANKFLQQAVGVAADGVIGPATLAAINDGDESAMINEISLLRIDFYNAIVNRNPAQVKFLKGWLRRIDEVTDFTMSKL